MQDELNFDKNAKIMQWEKEYFHHMDLEQLNIHVIGVHEEEEGNNGQKFSEENDSYEIVHLRSSVKTNLKKHE